MEDFSYLDIEEVPEYKPSCSREEEQLFSYRFERARQTIIAWNPGTEDHIVALIARGVAFDEVSPSEFDRLVLEKGCNPGLALQILA